MLLRLSVPPAEGQHHTVPKRPDPLGANATPPYAVLSSTALAAGYTTFATKDTRSARRGRRWST
ncbi:hypothetical protein P280DRAFT_514282 [Massarina eburnea CBS 473.64]|uniref:Uncharacterized protein n=1 Tax=Massarina eburnea CBS 473.64 TaxID=1395130 RepID=A0A6A6SC94_9PLEO|nr:hypothetical protein P280DRAFT_514282 [Massarina eburnea CBS 473.64]